MIKTVTALILFLLLNAVFPVRAAELFTFTVNTSAPSNRQLEWAVRIPDKYSPDSRIMVLFGGRNWNGQKAIKSYCFDRMADQYGVFLISPSFKDDDYWEPAKWSGAAMLEALKTVRRKFGLKDGKVFYYGYSAGAQCANLFYHWKPEIVAAWVAHACGVWFEPEAASTCPALITCGENDDGRFLLSERFVRNAREKGFPVIWRSYPGGHELNPAALKLAEAFFGDLLAGRVAPAYVGDDQTMRYYAIGTGNAADIEAEYRNVFCSRTAAEIWKNGQKQ